MHRIFHTVLSEKIALLPFIHRLNGGNKTRHKKSVYFTPTISPFHPSPTVASNLTASLLK
jgi:hypothetical protein